LAFKARIGFFERRYPALPKGYLLRGLVPPMDNAMTRVLVGFDAVTLVAGYLISASWD
jgi:hypothetical protein